MGGKEAGVDSPRLQEFFFDGKTYVAPSWNDMGIYTFELAQKILESGESFDRVIALAKGGWTWARTLVDYLEIKKLSSVQIGRYDFDQASPDAKIIQPLTQAISDENILVFDEVVDEGTTIIKAKEYLTVMGAKKIQVAALCCKPHTRQWPEYFAFQTSAWVFFPHEIREAVAKAGKNWEDLGRSREEIVERFKTIGLPEDQVRYFLDKGDLRQVILPAT